MSEDPGALLPTLHPRARRSNRYVYVVRSRRSGGLSVGINVDPQKTCNFDCAYCEVIDRREIAKRTGRPPIDHDEVAAELRAELRALLQGTESVRDISFAGDGEPSTLQGFLPLAEKLFDVRDEVLGEGGVPLVLITNGSGLDRREMREAHDLFARRGGVFWIKLDAGSEAYFRAICRTSIPFDRILANLGAAARRHPVVVQSMFLRLHGEGPPPEEIDAWVRRLSDVASSGGRLALVQIYTIARETMEPFVAALSAPELEDIAARLRLFLEDVPVETYS